MEVTNFARLFKAGKIAQEKPCALCGRHFAADESVALIVPPRAAREKYPRRLKNNLIAHANEFGVIVNACSTPEQVWDTLGKSKKPKKMQMTEEQKRRCDAFESAVRGMGYYLVSKTDSRVKCKKHGSTDTLEYSPYSDVIEYSNKRKRALFDGLVEREIVAQAYNRFHEILGDGKHDDYSALQAYNNVMTETIKTANKIMGM